MGPGQFVTQCVTNLVCQEERSHVAEVRGVEALAEFGRQACGEPVQDPFAIVGPALARLLLLDNDPPDFPVGLDHGRVDGLPGPVTGRSEDLLDSPVGRVESQLGRLPAPGWGRSAAVLAARLPGDFRFFAMPRSYSTPVMESTKNSGVSSCEAALFGTGNGNWLRCLCVARISKQLSP